MGFTNFYNLEDLETNTILENLNSKELSEILNITTSRISQLVDTDIICKGRYKITSSEVNPIAQKNGYPVSLLEEWDSTVKKFRR